MNGLIMSNMPRKPFGLQAKGQTTCPCAEIIIFILKNGDSMCQTLFPGLLVKSLSNTMSRASVPKRSC